MSAINATAAGALGQSRASGFGALSSGQFTEIILTELANQDPLEPNDTNALLEQLSSIRSIESDQIMADRLEAVVAQSEMSAAAGLIGKFVSGVSEQNVRTSEFVVSVSRTEEGPVLNLANGQRVSLSQVDEIIDPDELGGLLGDDEP